ncbi:MAG TPA: hypothetical protein VFF73_36355 [Planctomycetota bacterium]|nr:hypothetical protein [Planctomycetota bacterium]
MPETNQGPLDPAFAKFRDQKIVEKLTEKVNAPVAAVAAKVAAAVPPPKAAPATDRKAPLHDLDPEFDKFLEKARNEAEAEAVENDDARLFFGAGPPRKAEDGPPPVTEEEEDGARPAGVPAKVGESLKLIDIATGDAPPAPPVAKAPAAPVAKAALPRPISSPPRSGGEAGWGGKPAVRAPAPRVPAPHPNPPPASRGEGVAPASRGEGVARVEVPRVELPARPAMASTDGDLAAQLTSVRQKLSALLGESSSRLLELKVASSEGIDRAITAFEAEAKRLRECLERSEAMTDEAERAAAEASAQADLQDQLEERVRGLAETAVRLAARSTRLRESISELEATGARLDAEVTERHEAVERVRGEVDRLTERSLGLDRDVEDAEAVRARLAESVGRLEKLRDEHEAAIERLKAMKDALTKPVS